MGLIPFEKDRVAPPVLAEAVFADEERLGPISQRIKDQQSFAAGIFTSGQHNDPVQVCELNERWISVAQLEQFMPGKVSPACAETGFLCYSQELGLRDRGVCNSVGVAQAIDRKINAVVSGDFHQAFESRMYWRERILADQFRQLRCRAPHQRKFVDAFGGR